MTFSAPVEVRVEPALAIFIPNIFTPNHDGKNDVFELKLQYPRTFQLQVFNRWGREVFNTSTYGDFWTGSGASEGAYYYLCRYSTDCDPAEQTVKGWISLAP
ncbi:gliding motility-associated C-terminal domain-containing protein [Hymenobacter sp. BRD67]|uniref:gliding motility-associated C-terminal domain-containing protein n=1 Tax=Hymenobacter sp. BRD67 TaxID=2675877 RepID=UPI001564ED5A|nr:gliding motility-associated C-terminal domain-containing protein [Hymenobacter sp. BRD67]QKG54245.1 gliding motility-associated C-terminal domain-containing protein [Hymenobacter sp. BRD67]